MVTAPGKAWYYPEKIPDGFPKSEASKTNYEIFRQKLADYDVHYIDFNEKFLQLKDSLGILMYPKTGIHWSNYGAALAFDSVANYMKEQLGIDVPEYEIVKLDERSDKVMKDDDDLEKLMNLLFDIDNYQMIYPGIKQSSADKKPQILVVADSFFYAIFNLAKEVVNFDYYYYYKSQQSRESHFFTENVDEWVDRYDMILLLCTEAGIHAFPWGLLDDVDSVMHVEQPQLVKIEPSDAGAN